MSATARLAYVNVFARDIEALSGFYRALFGFGEIEGHRSPIYRCLDANGIELGFNASKAYELLALSDRIRDEGAAAVGVYFTVEMPTRAAIDDAAARVVDLGGRVIKPPYATYYNAYQAVLEDPEGNVFRINHRMGERRPFADTGLAF